MTNSTYEMYSKTAAGNALGIPNNMAAYGWGTFKKTTELKVSNFGIKGSQLNNHVNTCTMKECQNPFGR